MTNQIKPNPEAILKRYANDHNLVIVSQSLDKCVSKFIVESEGTGSEFPTHYGVDIYEDRIEPYTWGLPETHHWVKLMNDNNISVDIF